MTTASLRHRSNGGGLAEHLKAVGSDGAFVGVDDDASHHETSSVATVRTTNRSSSKSKHFYFKAVVLFVGVEVILLGYYNWPSLGEAASKTSTDEIPVAAVRPGANLTGRIITASNRGVRHGTFQQRIASRKRSIDVATNDVSGLTASDARRLVVDGARGAIQSILNETVCAPESAVLQQSSNVRTIDDVISKLDQREDEAEALTLVAQLIYAAIHENQYGPARNEALNQLNDDDTAVPFNLKCQDAKYILFEGFTSPTGLGSHLRSRMVIPTFLTGIAHGRIVLYIKADQKTPMTIVNCDRGDLECSFLPMSPCVLSPEDVASAMVVGKNWDDFLLNNTEEKVVKLSRSLERDFAAALKVGDKFKVVENFWTPVQRKQRMGLLLKGVSRIVATNLYDVPGRATDLEAAFRRLMKMELFQSRVIAAAQLFITRPNRKTRSQIQDAIERSFPPEYEPTKALGIPLRGSDKCWKEQKCVHFGSVMEQALTVFPMDDLRYLVITSEDAKYLDEAVIWKVMNGKQSSHLNIIMNKNDVMQATGQLQYLPGNKSMPMADILTSTMTAWAFQLRAGLSFLNICSNFHRLFEASIEFGCSAAVAWKQQNVECNVLV